VGQPRHPEPIPRPPGRIAVRRGQRRLLCYFTTVLAIEALDPAGRVNQPLRASVERMAIRADFDVQLVDRRARLKRVAACAGNHAAMIFRMDSGFHFLPSLWKNYIIRRRANSILLSIRVVNSLAIVGNGRQFVHLYRPPPVLTLAQDNHG
jgi:hypothetical protein